MADYLTTRELAALLRVKERKVYDLAADGTLPVRRVTGKLLFPRDEIEAWIVSSGGETKPAAGGKPFAAPSAAPAIIAGGHDPLLEWALRESRSGIAAFLDGALDALNRRPGEDFIGAGLHIPEAGDGWNVTAISEAFADRPVVLIEWAKRTRGLIFRRDLGRPVTGLSSVRGLRFQSRQEEAASGLVLARLLAREGLKKTDLNCIDTIERTETDLAAAIADGKADVGLGIEAMARQFRQGFTPLIVERFDLLVWRKAYFDPPLQKLFRFCASESFARKAAELGGYDVTGFGTVHFNGP